MKNINERRRARLGPNDYKRNKRARRQEDRALSVLTFTIILMVACMLTAL